MGSCQRKIFQSPSAYSAALVALQPPTRVSNRDILSASEDGADQLNARIDKLVTTLGQVKEFRTRKAARQQEWVNTIDRANLEGCVVKFRRQPRASHADSAVVRLESETTSRAEAFLLQLTKEMENVKCIQRNVLGWIDTTRIGDAPMTAHLDREEVLGVLHEELLAAKIYERLLGVVHYRLYGDYDALDEEGTFEAKDLNGDNLKAALDEAAEATMPDKQF